MSLRGFRVFGKTLEDGYFSVLVECTHTESFVLAKSGALLVIGIILYFLPFIKIAF